MFKLIGMEVVNVWTKTTCLTLKSVKWTLLCLILVTELLEERNFNLSYNQSAFNFLLKILMKNLGD